MKQTIQLKSILNRTNTIKYQILKSGNLSSIACQTAEGKICLLQVKSPSLNGSCFVSQRYLDEILQYEINLIHFTEGFLVVP